MTAPIETMIGRDLDREPRAGIPHYVPGQAAARRVDHDPAGDPLNVYELSFVDALGHAWIVIVDNEDGWLPLCAWRGGQHTVHEAPPPATLHPDWVAALEAAR